MLKSLESLPLDYLCISSDVGHIQYQCITTENEQHRCLNKKDINTTLFKTQTELDAITVVGSDEYDILV